MSESSSVGDPTEGLEDEPMNNEEEEASEIEEDEANANDDTAKDEKKSKREKKKFDFERNSRTIFVGNLPNTFDKRKLAKLFKACGPIETARIRSVVPQKEKLSPKVALITKKLHPKVDSFNGFVVFKTNEDDVSVKSALMLNGTVVQGHHLRVDRATRPRAKKESLTSRKKSVFVGNLRFDLRTDDLVNYFTEKVGEVDHVRLVRDSGTGMGKGFGFVAFKERASVKKALELNDLQFKGRQMRVQKISC